MNGISTGNKVSFINENEFDKHIITKTDNYVFVYSDQVETSKIVKLINMWKDKYPDFGSIISSKGILIDCSKYSFEIESRKSFAEDLHHQSIANGIISIRDEYISNYI